MKRRYSLLLSFITAAICASCVFAQSQNHDLYEVNRTSGTRSFTINGDYNIDASLPQAWSGSLTVKGAAPNAKDSVLSGVLISTDGTVPGGKGSLFKIIQGTDFILKDLTVSSAQVSGSGAALNAGANSLTVIENVIFDGNYASQYGGAIYGAGTVNVSTAVFLNNAANFNGGAVFNGGTLNLAGPVAFSSNSVSGSGAGGAVYNNTGGIISAGAGSFVLFEYNSALSGSRGGALYNQGGVSFDSAAFTGNQASAGGGAVSNASGAQAYFNNAVFDLNKAANGGALYNAGGGRAAVTGSASFISNSASTFGGALYNEAGGLFVSTEGVSVFESNTAGVLGGALYNAGTVWLDSASFYNNSASSAAGGAIYNAGGTANLYNVSMTSNSAAASGGALYASSGTVNFAGDILFSSNIAAASGGAIYIGKGAAVDLSQANITAIGNTAGEKGGFLYNDGQKIVIDLDKISLTSNTAKDGGDFYSSGGSLIFGGGASTISYSYASTNGGSVYSSFGMADFSGASLTAMHSGAGNNGGFIYLDNGSARFKDAYFYGNTAGNKGGVIYIQAYPQQDFSTDTTRYVSISGNSVFENNSARDGGAIYYESQNDWGIFTIAGGASFIGNSALEKGGAIYVKQGSMRLNSDAGDITFTSNSANSLPNDIYSGALGIILINGNSNNVVINGGIAGDASAPPAPWGRFGIFKSGTGGLVINGGSGGYNGNFSVTGGNVEVNAQYFTGYTELTGGNVNINQGGNITSGNINVSGGDFTIYTADNLVFSGTFTGAGGNLIKDSVSSGSLTFAGAGLSRRIDIYGGSLTASTGTVFSLGEQVVLHDRNFYIDTPDSLYIYSHGLQNIDVTGSTTTKTGTGTLYIIGNNSGYTGLFEQYAGKTEVTSAYGRYGHMFTGVNNIYDSVLDVTQSNYTRVRADLEHNVNLFDNAVQYYRNRTITQTVISTHNVTFKGNDATAYFGKAREDVRKALYMLNGTFENSGGGSGNKVVFDNSIVTLSAADYLTASDYVYEFNKSVLDLVHGASTRTVTFDNLTVNASSPNSNGIIVGINFANDGGWSAGSDKLVTNPLSSSLWLCDVLLYSGADDPSLPAGYYYTQTLYGGLTFDTGTANSFTVLKEFNTFNIDVNTSTLTGLDINVVAGFDLSSLYKRNAQKHTRGFSLEVEGVYNIDKSLSDTEEGIFIVNRGESGIDKNPGKYIISGVIISTDPSINGQRGSFFNLDKDTDFSFKDLTVTSAAAMGSGASGATQNGSVLRMTNSEADAVFQNTVFSYNESANDGGAIYATAGLLFLDSVTATGNLSGNNGGFAYLGQNVFIKFDNPSSFTNNRAGGSGGVYYVTNNASAMSFDNSKIVFSSNSAVSAGGAIATIKSPMDFLSSDIVFSYNSAPLGGAIYTDSSGTNFLGSSVYFQNNKASSGGAIYASGQASTITFTESSAQFTGNEASTAGGAIAVVNSTLTVNADLSDILFSGNTAPADAGNDAYIENSVLNLNVNGGQIVFQGGAYSLNGKINKSGSGLLQLEGINSLNGDFTATGGRVNIYNASYSHSHGTFTLTGTSGLYINHSSVAASDVFTHITNNSAGINVSNHSSATFSGGAEFINNVSEGLAGVALTNNDNSSVSFENGDVVFALNVTDADKNSYYYVDNGVVYNTNSSLLSFTNAGVSFESNTAKFGAAITNSENSGVTFNGGSALFNNNISDGLNYGKTPAHLLGGGAIYNDKSTVEFNSSTAVFTNNQAANGAAIANVNGAAISFTSGSVIFSTNQTAGYGYDDKTFNAHYGGAIYNVGATVNFSGADASFENNRSFSGGAIYNNSNAKIIFSSGSAKFTDNSVVNVSHTAEGVWYAGGGVYNGGGSELYFNGGDVEFSTNTGGAIFNIEGSTVAFKDVDSALFAHNTSLLSGGAVYNGENSYVLLSGNIDFSGNVSNAQGGAVYNAGTLDLTSVNSSTIVFSSSSYNKMAGSNNDIYNTASGIINVNGASGVVIVNGGIAGAGNINKSGGGVFRIAGNSSGFTGRFYQDGGLTLVTSNYFQGVSSVTTGGVLEFSSGTVLGGGVIGLYGGGDLEITAPGNLTFSGQIRGDGYINKSGSGTLSLTGDNRGFTGIFSQTAGTTTVNNGAWMFTGENNISNSTLNVTHSYNTMGYNVNLGNNGVSNYYGNYSGITNISTQNVSFTGNNARAYFGSSNSTQRRYHLEGTFANAGTGGEVSFNNSYVSFGSGDYANGTLYSFANSVLDINNGLTAPGSTRTVSFSNLAVSNSSLNFGVNFAGNSVESDRLHTAQSTGTLNLGVIAVKNDNDAGGQNLSHKIKVLEGVEFTQNGAHKDIATSAYHYDVSVATDDAHYVVMNASGPADAYSLDRQNMKSGERYYIWSIGNYVYQEGDSLHNMNDGQFQVLGYNGDASNSVLSGVLTGVNVSTGRGTFFNIESGTDVAFTLANVTVTSAMANGFATSTGSLNVPFTRSNDSDGSVLRMMSAASTATISNVIFNDNGAAGKGGAIYAGGGTLNISSSVFSNNSAGTAGGAMYITESEVNFLTDAGGIYFTNNAANGKANDIYLGDGAKLNVYGSGGVSLEGGFDSDSSATGIEVSKYGSGTLRLGGTNKVYGDFTASSGAVAFINDASYEGGNFTINGSAVLDVHNSSANYISVENYSNENSYKIDVFSNGGRDYVFASSSAVIGGSIEIYLADSSSSYVNNRYYLVTASQSLTGRYSSSWLSDALRYRLFYDSNNVWLDVNYMYVSTFSKLPGLTFNQSETAKAIDKISHNPSIEWGNIIDHLMWDLTESQQLQVLSTLSGYFISNVVRNAAADSPSSEIYDKVKKHLGKDEKASGLWLQVKGGFENFDGDKESLGSYKDAAYGAMFGYDKFFRDDLTFGVYLRFNRDDITQQGNKADGLKSGLGFYGGLIKESWEVKAMLLGSYDQFNLSRDIPLPGGGRKAESDMDAVTVNADIEGALKYEMSERWNLRPFLGLEAQNVNYSDFDESGAGSFNLNVKGGSYFRSAARLGADLQYSSGIWKSYVGVEAKWLITGYRPEIESVFEKTDAVFKSRGASEGQLEGGIGAGTEARIARNWIAFANAKFLGSDHYQGVFGNLGIRYVFGIRNAKVDDLLAEAERLSFLAERQSYEVVDMAKDERYDEAEELGVEGIGNANVSLQKLKELKEALLDDEITGPQERAKLSQRMPLISDRDEEAKKRIKDIIYGGIEIKDAKILIGEAVDNVIEAENIKKGGGSGKDITDYANTAIEKTRKADEKLDKAQDKSDKLGAGLERAKRAVKDADTALEKLNSAQHAFGEAILTSGEVEALNKAIKTARQEALEVRERAMRLIEFEQNAFKRANEKKINPQVKRIVVDVTHFGFDKDAITKEGREALKKSVQEIKAHKYKKVSVEGHTCNLGAREYNKDLSKRRADAVRKELIALGIDADKITCIGHGDSIPIKNNGTARGRKENRRTEIYFE
jgi:predicted outer membrane repeat protein